MLFCVFGQSQYKHAIVAHFLFMVLRIYIMKLLIFQYFKFFMIMYFKFLVAFSFYSSYILSTRHKLLH